MEHEKRFAGTPERLRRPDRVELLEVDKVLDLVLEGIEAETALDVGTGSGVFAEAFARRGLRVTGIDPNPEMISASQRYVPDGIARSLAEHSPGSELTEREMQVLQLLIKGLSNNEIGGLLGCSKNTAKFHVKNILVKLQVSDRTEAATAAFQRGILP